MNAESKAAREHLEILISRDEASSRGVGSSEQHDQQEASRELPSESRAASLATPETDCTDPSTFSWGVSHIAAVLNSVMFSSTSWDLEAGLERVSAAGRMQSEQVRRSSRNIRG